MLPRGRPTVNDGAVTGLREGRVTLTARRTRTRCAAPHEPSSWGAQSTQLHRCRLLSPCPLPARRPPRARLVGSAVLLSYTAAGFSPPARFPRAAPHELGSWGAQSTQLHRCRLLSPCPLPARRPPRARLVGSTVSSATPPPASFSLPSSRAPPPTSSARGEHSLVSYTAARFVFPSLVSRAAPHELGSWGAQSTSANRCRAITYDSP